MSYPVYGDVTAGSTLYIPFTSYDKDDGSSITMTGLAVTDIEIYKNGSTTQRASDNGYTLLDTDGIDFDGVTGLHGFSIDLSDNTDSGFYTAGAWYWVVVSTVTIDSVVVTFIAAVFRIRAAESVAGTPKVDVSHLLGTAWLTPGTAGTPDVNTKLAGGTAWGSGAITAASIANGAIDAATFAADVDAEILSYLVDDATRIDASALNTLSGHDPGETIMGATDALSVSELQASALADLFNTDSGTTYASAVAGSVVKEVADNAGGASLTVQDIVDGVWDEPLASHQDADSMGEALADAGGAGTPPTAAEVADAVWDEATAGHTTSGTFGEQLKTDVDAILADTAEIGAAGAGLTEAGGTGDQLTAVAWNAAWDAEVQSEAEDALVAKGLDHLVAASVAGSDITDNSIIAKLVSKSATADWDDFVNTTDALQALRDRGDAAWVTATGFSTLDAAGIRSAVGLASANLDTQLAAIDDFLDTEVAAILAAVDTEVAAIKAKTDSLTFTVSNQLDANVQAINDVGLGGNGTEGNEWGPA